MYIRDSKLSNRERRHIRVPKISNILIGTWSNWKQLGLSAFGREFYLEQLG